MGGGEGAGGMGGRLDVKRNSDRDTNPISNFTFSITYAGISSCNALV